MRKRHDQEAEADQRQSTQQQALFTETARKTADHPPLQDRREHADIGENIADLARTPAELLDRPERESALHPREGQDDQEKDQDQAQSTVVVLHR